MIDLGTNPKVQLVVDYVREHIAMGGLADGNTLPSAPALAFQLGVSKRTALVACQYLASTGELIAGRRYRVNREAGEPMLFGVEDKIFYDLQSRIEDGRLAVGARLVSGQVSAWFDAPEAAGYFALLRLFDLGYLDQPYAGCGYTVRSDSPQPTFVAHPVADTLLDILREKHFAPGTELPGMRTLLAMVEERHAGVHFLSIRRAEHFLAAIGKLTKLPSGRFSLAA